MLVRRGSTRRGLGFAHCSPARGITLARALGSALARGGGDCVGRYCPRRKGILRLELAVFVRMLEVSKHLSAECRRWINGKCHHGHQRFCDGNATVTRNHPLSAFEHHVQHPTVAVRDEGALTRSGTAGGWGTSRATVASIDSRLGHSGGASSWKSTDGDAFNDAQSKSIARANVNAQVPCQRIGPRR